MKKTSANKPTDEISLEPTLKEVLPRHIAIVLDGNGRWAQTHGLPRSEGHIRGSQIVEEIVNAAGQLGVERLTLYCFSSENWKRPQSEIDALMELLRSFMVLKRPTMMKNNIRLRVIGRRIGIPENAQAEIDETIRLTSQNTGLTLALAINYGSRGELVDAIRSIVSEITDPTRLTEVLNHHNCKTLDALITERYVASKLYDGEAPDPDLFIRTGGEHRLSNYLLWQLSYTELWFTDTLWPDFTPEKLREAIRWYQSRHRRFGGLDQQTQGKESATQVSETEN